MNTDSRLFINTTEDTILLTCHCRELSHGALKFTLDEEFHILDMAASPYSTKNWWVRLKNAWYELTGQVGKIQHNLDFLLDSNECLEFCKAMQELIRKG